MGEKLAGGSSMKAPAGDGMGEENIRRFFEAIARIVSEREQVKVTVQVLRGADSGRQEAQEG